MERTSLVQRFLAAEMHLTPEALDIISKSGDDSVDRVVASIREMPSRPFVITADLVNEILKGEELGEKVPPTVPPPQEKVQAPPSQALHELSHFKFRPLAADIEPRVEVLQDLTGKSYSKGELQDFVDLFNDRFKKLSRILMKRVDFQGTIPIGSLRNLGDGERAKTIGMILDKRETSGGHVLMEVEDPTGKISAWIFKGQQELMAMAAETVVDEVVGLDGVVRKGDRGPRFLVKDLIRPELPVSREVNHADEPVNVAMLSDLHVGSEMFLEDMFLKFLKWLRGEIGSREQREFAGRVKYLVIAGDVCDGVGIYPQQEEELLVTDVFKQYDLVAELLSQVPEYIKIIITPGNHDAVRPSEPQPAIPREVAGKLYDLNSMMLGNPVTISLHGVKYLIYHGRSFDDLVATLPTEGDNPSPEKLMIKLLQRRHLAPAYGGKVAVAPEKMDYLVIEDVPDVLHCGHIHIYGSEKYRNVLAVNSGTFQAVTTYMKRKGIRPTPGIVPVLDLKSHQLRRIQFA